MAINANRFNFGGYPGAAEDEANRLKQQGGSLAGQALGTQDRALDVYGGNRGSTVLYGGASRADPSGIDALRQFAARGAGPSVAEAQLRQGAEAAMRSNLSMARSGAPGTQAQALRQAMFQNAAQQQQTNQGAAILRAQESAAERQLQGSALQAALQGQLGAQAQRDALMQAAAQQDLALTQAGLQQQQLNNAYGLGLGQLGLGYEQQGMAYQQQQAELNALLEQLRMQRSIANQQANTQRDAALIGAGGQVLGGLLGVFSDETVKTNVQALRAPFTSSTSHPPPGEPIGNTGVTKTGNYPNPGKPPDPSTVFGRTGDKNYGPQGYGGALGAQTPGYLGQGPITPGRANQPAPAASGSLRPIGGRGDQLAGGQYGYQPFEAPTKPGGSGGTLGVSSWGGNVSPITGLPYAPAPGSAPTPGAPTPAPTAPPGSIPGQAPGIGGGGLNTNDLQTLITALGGQQGQTYGPGGIQVARLPSVYEGVLSDVGAKNVMSDVGSKNVYSDDRAKNFAGGNGNAALDLVRNAPGYSYEYKPGMGPPGMHVGPMAQDLERTPAGRSLVFPDQNGLKRVDAGGLTMANTAALNTQQQQIDELRALLARLGGRA